jgi:hypothetical protein
MTLVLDNRAQLGQVPALHVLIAGVSLYPHLPDGGGTAAPDDFGMQQLTSTALSAFRLYEWIVDRQGNFPMPLATIRLLLAPSEAEIDVEPQLAGVNSSCELGQFQTAAMDWRADAAVDPAGMTLFYFAGHGVQRSKGDSVLLLQDFGDGRGGALDKAINFRSLHNGMAPSRERPNISRMQLYFVDACRLRPERFSAYEQMNTGNVWDVELSGEDDRRAPIYFASVPGALAYAWRGKQTLFNQALLDCLDGGAADLRDEGGQERWMVTHMSLQQRLAEYLPQLAGEAGAEQSLRSDGFGKDAVIYYCDEAPIVRIELEVDPLPALNFVKVAILDDAQQPATQNLPKPLEPHPYETDLPAGIYTILAQIDPENPLYVDLPGRAQALRGPLVKKKLTVKKRTVTP